MGKVKYYFYKLVSTANTGYYYLGKKSTKNVTNKLTLLKHDPVVNRHVIFTEQKYVSGRKRHN